MVICASILECSESLIGVSLTCDLVQSFPAFHAGVQYAVDRTSFVVENASVAGASKMLFNGGAYVM